MGQSIIYNFEDFFKHTKNREKFLQDLIDRWSGVKFGMKTKDPADIAFYNSLTAAEKKEFDKKLLKAMDLRNEIFNKRKNAIKSVIK